MSDIIKTEKLTKFYGKSRGIVDVDLNVSEGDFFGFIGPNGAGKSTAIRTLLGLIAPTGGRAEIFGMNIREKRTEILSDVGFLPSEALFYSGMRVKEIIELSAKLRRRDCRAEASALCERLELDMSKRICELSLGNRKKVGIVCAMQHRPRLYIMDEPTSGLDPLMQREFYSLLSERNREGATVFLSSHILSEVGRYCTVAAVIREGRILACDSVERLGHTGVKRVVLKGIKDKPDIPGMKNITFENDTLNFLFGGNIKELLAELSRWELEDISITDPDLEEVFMSYYAGEDKNDDAFLA